MRRLTGLIVLVMAGAFAGAQQIGQNKPAGAGDNFTLTVKVQLVVEAVVVKDKDGKPIQGLTAKDFALTEDGAPQSISFCEHQALAGHAEPLPVAAPGSEDIKIYKRLTHMFVDKSHGVPRLVANHPLVLRVRDSQ